jgi:hypothetical protein
VWGLICGLLALFLEMTPGFAAQGSRTDFSTGFGPWAGSGDGDWTIVEGVARCSFPQSLLPLRTRLTVDCPCDFTGCYSAGEIAMIGLDFKSGSMRPCSISIELRSSNQYLRCYFRGDSTTNGEARTFVAALEPLAPVPGWSGNISAAKDILRSVEQVIITIWGGSMNEAQSFDIDNIFICSAPQSSAMDFTLDPVPGPLPAAGDEVSGLAVTWSGLQPGLVYTVETAPDLRGPWIGSGTITAVTSTASTTLPKGDGAVARLSFAPFLGP